MVMIRIYEHTFAYVPPIPLIVIRYIFPFTHDIICYLLYICFVTPCRVIILCMYDRSTFSYKVVYKLFDYYVICHNFYTVFKYNLVILEIMKRYPYMLNCRIIH